MRKYNGLFHKLKERIALTFLEIVIAVFIITIAIVGFSRVFQVGMDSINKANQETMAHGLARGLMSEIMSKAFCDPACADCNSCNFGTESGEARTGGVNTFDDVDDYNSYNKTPPIDIRGNSMDGTAGTPNYKGFRESAVVDYVILNAGVWGVSPSPTNYKGITVTISSPGISNITLVEVKVK